MARKPLGMPTGVEVIGNSIRIRFMWNGTRKCETLPYPATQKGIKTASSLRDQVVQAIKLGIMDEAKYAEFFPGSAIAESVSSQIPLFGEHAQLWLDSREIVLGTRKNYKSILNQYWMPHLAVARLDQITPTLLRRIISSIEWTSPGVKRNAMFKLSTILDSAVKDGLIKKNPMAPLEKPRVSKKLVDPFTRDEAERIIQHLYATLGKYSRIYAALYEFLFFTGLRPGEAFALRWDEVDEEARRIHVRRIVIDRGIEERVKTKHERDVLLNDRALNALAEAKRIARLKRVASVSEFAVSPFVFPPEQGRAVDQGAKCYHKALPRRAGCSIHPKAPAVRHPPHIRDHVPDGRHEPCFYRWAARPQRADAAIDLCQVAELRLGLERAGEATDQG